MRNAQLTTFLLPLLLFVSSAVHAEEVKVIVKGMVCSFCAQGVKKTFEKYPDVLDASVDLETKIVTLQLKEGTTMTDSEIEQAITDAGYAVEKIERERAETGFMVR